MSTTRRMFLVGLAFLPISSVAQTERTPILTDAEAAVLAKYRAIKGGMTLAQANAVVGKRPTMIAGDAAWTFGTQRELTIAVVLLGGRVAAKTAKGGRLDGMELMESYPEVQQRYVAESERRNAGKTSFDGVLVTTGKTTPNPALRERFESIKDGMGTEDILVLLGQPNIGGRGIPKHGRFKGKQVFFGIWAIDAKHQAVIVFVGNKVAESEIKETEN